MVDPVPTCQASKNSDVLFQQFALYCLWDASDTRSLCVHCEQRQSLSLIVQGGVAHTYIKIGKFLHGVINKGLLLLLKPSRWVSNQDDLPVSQLWPLEKKGWAQLRHYWSVSQQHRQIHHHVQNHFRPWPAVIPRETLLAQLCFMFTQENTKQSFFMFTCLTIYQNHNQDQLSTPHNKKKIKHLCWTTKLSSNCSWYHRWSARDAVL